MNKPGALFKFKTWLTISESAEYLSKIFNDDVTKADVLRLSLDGHLKLSVRFANDTYAKRGRRLMEFHPYELEKDPLPIQMVESVETILDPPYIDEERVFRFTMNDSDIPDRETMDNSHDISIDEVKKGFKAFKKKIQEAADDNRNWVAGQGLGFAHERNTLLKGVYDLVMVEAGVLHVEHKWQQFIDGSDVVERTSSNGFFVEDTNGTIYALQECKKADNYIPARTLPDNSVLVIRTQSLIDLQNRVAGNKNELKKDLDHRKEKTYLNIIGALLECITGQFKDEVFTSETQLREFIDEKFDDLNGVRSRTLIEKFSQAKKALRGEL